MSICELKSVSKDYGSGVGKVRALSNINLSIGPGEFTVFMGPSGSGKTTLLNLVGCLDVPSEGDVFLEGTNVGDLSQGKLAALRAKNIGFIFQSFNLIPVLTAQENVELALQLANWSGDYAKAAAESLEAVGLGDYKHRLPNQMSGGQQQRVAIARALVKQPVLVIADEPTANLDSKTGSQILDIMRDMNKSMGVTFIFSTHDPMVMERASRIVVLKDGLLAEDRRQEGGA